MAQAKPYSFYQPSGGRLDPMQDRSAYASAPLGLYDPAALAAVMRGAGGVADFLTTGMVNTGADIAGITSALSPETVDPFTGAPVAGAQVRPDELVRAQRDEIVQRYTMPPQTKAGAKIQDWFAGKVGQAVEAAMPYIQPAVDRWQQMDPRMQALAMAPIAAAGVVGPGKFTNVPKPRQIGTTGQFAGAPRGVNTPAKLRGASTQYMNRTQEALDAGIEPGYFYAKGNEAINRVAEDPVAFARQLAVTSSEAPVGTNTGWGIKGATQQAMGQPVVTGKYPVEVGKSFEKVQTGADIGPKREPYANALLNPGRSNLAPNDRWEIRSMGYMNDKGVPLDSFSPDGPQHPSAHYIRQEATNMMNAKRAKEGLPPLSIDEMQELQWKAYRSNAMGTPINEINLYEDTVHGSIPSHTMQGSWETAPGRKSGHFTGFHDRRGLEPDLDQTIMDTLEPALLDPRGRDATYQALGMPLQDTVLRAPGVFEGQVSAGRQSRGLVQNKMGTSEADRLGAELVKSGEMFRGVATGQDAIAGHMLSPAKSLSGTDTVNITRPQVDYTPDQARAMDALLKREFGVGDYGQKATMVAGPNGVRVLKLDEIPNFAKRMEALDAEIKQIFPDATGQTRHTRSGTKVTDEVTGKDKINPDFYEDIPWQGEGAAPATNRLVQQFESVPGLPAHANSPQMRTLAGNILEQTLAAAQKTGLPPNPKIITFLETWKREGYAGIKHMLKDPQLVNLLPAAIPAALLANAEEETALLAPR